MYGRLALAVPVVVVIGLISYVAVDAPRVAVGMVGAMVCMADIGATGLYFWPRGWPRDEAEELWAVVLLALVLAVGVALTLWGFGYIFP